MAHSLRSKKVASPTWKTQDGRVLEVKWMESAHLVNAVNVIADKYSALLNGNCAAVTDALKKTSVFAEAKARGLAVWEDDVFGPPKLKKVKQRESVADLCAMHACREHKVTLAQYTFEALEQAASVFEELQLVLATAVALRLTR